MAKGNTLGRVQGQQATPAAVAPEEANPSVRPETPLELDWLDALQMLLDLVGLFPALGSGADLLNGVISLLRGDFIGAGLSLLGVAPILGEGTTLAKIAAHSERYYQALRVVEANVLPLLPGPLRRQMEDWLAAARRELDGLTHAPPPKPREAPEQPAPPGKPGGDVQVKPRDKSRRPGEPKGRFGERRTEEELREQGYEKVSADKHPNANGIDSVWKNPKPPPDYVIVESKFETKYGTNPLRKTLDGKQMSDSWINGSVTGTDRLGGAVGKEVALDIKTAMNNGSVDKVLARINPAGDVIFKKLDSAGKIIGPWP